MKRIKGAKKDTKKDEHNQSSTKIMNEVNESPERKPARPPASSSSRNLQKAPSIDQLESEFMMHENHPGDVPASSSRVKRIADTDKQTEQQPKVLLKVLLSKQVKNLSHLQNVLDSFKATTETALLLFPTSIFTEEVSVSSLSQAATILKQFHEAAGTKDNYLGMFVHEIKAAEELMMLSGFVKSSESLQSIQFGGYTATMTPSSLRVLKGKSVKCEVLFPNDQTIETLLIVEDDRGKLSHLFIGEKQATKDNKPSRKRPSSVSQQGLQLEDTQRDTFAEEEGLRILHRRIPQQHTEDHGDALTTHEVIRDCGQVSQLSRILPADFPQFLSAVANCSQIDPDDENELDKHPVMEFLGFQRKALVRAVGNSLSGTVTMNQLPGAEKISRDTMDEQLSEWIGLGLSRSNLIELQAANFAQKVKDILPSASSVSSGLPSAIPAGVVLQSGMSYEEDAFEDEFKPGHTNGLYNILGSIKKVERNYNFGEDDESAESESEQNNEMDTQTRDLMELEEFWQEENQRMMTEATPGKKHRSGLESSKKAANRGYQSEPVVKKQIKRS